MSQNIVHVIIKKGSGPQSH